MNNDLTILGKFKTVKALKDAYDALQREFTKKCQKLSLLSGKKEDNFDANECRQSLETLPKEALLNMKPSLATEKNPTEIAATTTANTVFPQGNSVEETLIAASDNPDCKNIDGQVDADPFLTMDADFAEKYILSNPQFMEMLLAKYLKQLSLPKAPNVIGGSGFFSLTPPLKPTSVAEAGILAGKMFDKR